MDNIKLYTDEEQGRKLAKILPEESADMYWEYDNFQKFHRIELFEIGFPRTLTADDIPAWSLAALIKALPKKPCREYNLVISEEPPYFAFDDLELNIHKDYDGADCVDACVNMILQLHDKGLL